MKRLVASAVCCVSLGVAVGFGIAASTQGHGHVPVSMPSSWTKDQITDFRRNSDRLIDGWAGRVVAPGEIITHEGLAFRKSTPEEIATGQRCTWCPKRQACHN